MAPEFAFTFNHEKCIQCHSCDLACKSWRNTEQGVHWRRVKHHWIGQYPQIRSIPFSTSCMHCVDPACVDSCPVNALHKNAENGIVTVDSDECTGCRTCFEECPFHIPEFGMDEKMQKCDMCVNEAGFGISSPPCVETCPTGALQFLKMLPEEKKVAERLQKEFIEEGEVSAVKLA